MLRGAYPPSPSAVILDEGYSSFDIAVLRLRHFDAQLDGALCKRYLQALMDATSRRSTARGSL